jgi:hypothetical protein
MSTLKNVQNNFDVDLILQNYVRKLNYLLITGANGIYDNIFDNIDSNMYSGKKFSYIIQESILIENSYNENIFRDINNYIEINQDKKVIINDSYDNTPDMNKREYQPSTTIASYVSSGLWNNLKHIKLTNIIKNSSLDIKIFLENSANEFNFTVGPAESDACLRHYGDIIKQGFEKSMWSINFKIEDLINGPPAPAAAAAHAHGFLPPAPAAAAAPAPAAASAGIAWLPPAPAALLGFLPPAPAPVPLSLAHIEAIKMEVNSIKNTIIDVLIDNYKITPKFNEKFNENFPAKDKYIKILKQKINGKFTSGFDIGLFPEFNMLIYAQKKQRVSDVIVKILTEEPYPADLLTLLTPDEKKKLVNKLVICDHYLTHPKTKMIYDYINDQFNIIEATLPAKYNATVIANNIEKNLNKKYKKDKFIKEVVFLKYANQHNIQYKTDKEIKKEIIADLKNAISKFDDAKYYSYADTDLYTNIKNEIYKSYSDEFKKKFSGTQQKALEAHLNAIKGMKNQYGGYNSINHELNMIKYKIVKDGNGNIIINQNLISGIDGIHFNDDGTETTYKLPSKLQIYYEIENIDTREIKKMILITLHYERSDILKRSHNKDYFFQNDHTYKKPAELNIIYYTKYYNIKNVISLFDAINFLYNSVIQKNNIYMKKNLFKLIFLLNLLNNINYPLLHEKIIDHININLPYYENIERLCRTIIQIFNTIITTQNDAYELYRFINGLHLNIIGQTTLDNYNVNLINLGNPFTLHNEYNFITAESIITYKRNFESLTDRYLIKNFDNIKKMLYGDTTKFTIPLKDVYALYITHNLKILGIHPPNSWITEISELPKNSIVRIHTEHIIGSPINLIDPINKIKLEVCGNYTGSFSKDINSLLYRLFIISDEEIRPLFDNRLNITNHQKDYLNIALNLYEIIMTIDNSTFEQEYLILNSSQDLIFGTAQIPSISDFNIGDEFFVPYMISATANTVGVFQEKRIGYKFIIIVPTNEKYLTVFGKYGPDKSISSVQYENEIILPPGYYKFISIAASNNFSEHYECVVLYESLKLNTSDPDTNLNTRPITKDHDTNYISNLKYAKAIREQMLKHNTLLDKQTIVKKTTLKEIDLDKESIPYMGNANFIGLSKLIPKPDVDINSKMTYELSNISPIRNIFSIASSEYHQNEGKPIFKCFKINYKTLLYSGQNVTQIAFDKGNFLGMNKETALYLSNLLVASSYGIAHQHVVRNNYTFLLDGTDEKDIILFDNFDPDNIKKLKIYYDTLVDSDEYKIALDGYYKFSNTHYGNNADTKFVWNSDPIRIKYNDLYYSSKDGDYSKKSISTENDHLVSKVYNELFGKHDGYISRAQFASGHFNAVFDDEICLYNFYELKDQNKIHLLINHPTTIIKELMVNYIRNPATDIHGLHMLVANIIYSLRKIIEKTKVNRLFESFKYSFMFDKYVPYQFYPYEKYFRNIYDILHRNGLMNILVNNIPIANASNILPIPIPIIPLIGGNYKEKYLKYKEKYLKLKKMLN